jgi:hypothetical protein
LRGGELSRPYRLPLGAVIGSAHLYDVRPTETIEADPYGDYSPGRFGWSLQNVTRCRPITYPGQLQLWTLPDDIAEQLV